MKLSKITPCLWFDGQAEEAAEFYVSIFDDSRIVAVTRFTEAGHEIHGQQAGTVMTVSFELAGQSFTALNGGPMFKFTEAISLQVDCADQAEVDYYWKKLSAGGDPEAQNCGWLKDRFGVSWQVVPNLLTSLLAEGDPAAAKRVLDAVLQMKKLDIAEIERAYRG
jgi:predicted 3-demethylubiquinone-9 3-methyltransferase (glyoxalase superfamily)